MMNSMLTSLVSLVSVGLKSRPTKSNPSGLRPAGHAVLLEPYEPDFDAARRTGLIIPENQRNNSIMVEMRAIVVELGDMAYRKDYQNWFLRLITPWRPRCKPGDKIMVQSYSGAIVVGTLDGKQYRLVNDEDVFVQIVAEAVKPEFPH
jgi:co-chaperonin GroES (HSP10)